MVSVTYFVLISDVYMALILLSYVTLNLFLLTYVITAHVILVHEIHITLFALLSIVINEIYIALFVPFYYYHRCSLDLYCHFPSLTTINTYSYCPLYISFYIYIAILAPLATVTRVYQSLITLFPLFASPGTSLMHIYQFYVLLCLVSLMHDLYTYTAQAYCIAFYMLILLSCLFLLFLTCTCLLYCYQCVCFTFTPTVVDSYMLIPLVCLLFYCMVDELTSIVLIIKTQVQTI